MQFTVRLPRDGALYHCTYTNKGYRCRAETKFGLTQAFYDEVRSKLPKGVTTMRAICPKHLEVLKEYVNDDSAL
jgi:hypothetical protein